MKTSKKAARIWAKNPHRPAFKKIAGSAYWLDGDTKPRIPRGGPKRKA